MKALRRALCWLIGHRWGRAASVAFRPYDRLVTEVAGVIECDSCGARANVIEDVPWDIQVRDKIPGWSIEDARLRTAASVEGLVKYGPAWLP